MRDRLAVTLIGPSATPGQVINGQVATCLYHCWLLLEKLQNEHVDSVYSVVKPGIKVRVLQVIIQSLLTKYSSERICSTRTNA